jgi:hypothetical protein
MAPTIRGKECSKVADHFGGDQINVYGNHNTGKIVNSGLPPEVARERDFLIQQLRAKGFMSENGDILETRGAHEEIKNQRGRLRRLEQMAKTVTPEILREIIGSTLANLLSAALL